ncbi:MAG: 50S ribosomal protein L7ae [Clostridiaceae bacterium]|jgi:ribosomal protein L7Ae-like RNA K-turn-binding protein|nr:50S ribosomal protein L7ae [Clostridiaceae bacterium]
MSEDKIYSFIGLAKKAGAVMAGEELTVLSVKRGKASLVILARDASLNTRKKIETALYNRNIPLIEFGQKDKLGQRLGKPFFSVISVINRGFADKIKELIEQSKNKDNTAHGGDFFE